MHVEMSGSVVAKPPAAARRFTTASGVPVEQLYGPENLPGFDPARDLGEPGAFPYTRGIHPSMYRGKLWTMRQFSGFATPEETNLLPLPAETGTNRAPSPSICPR
jgi:methylmalonyl-CoA mutase N-terminal domain/subunit